MSSDVAEMTHAVSSVPGEWHSSKLGEVLARAEGGGTPPRDVEGYWNGDIPWASVKDIVKGNGSIPEETITAAGLANSSSRIVAAGTNIFVARMGVGAVTRYPMDVAINQDLMALTPIEELDPDYLYHWLRSNKAAFVAVATGTTVKGIRKDLLLSFPLSLPPLYEQRRIAEVLRSVDEAIATADLVLAQAKLVRQSAIDELLSPGDGMAGPDRLSCSLSEVLSIAHGFPFKSEYFTSNRDDPILLTPGNFSVEKTLYFGERTKHYSGPVPDGYVLEGGSLVVVMTDLTQDMAILGNAVEISGNGVVLHNQRIGRVSLLRPDLITKGYARLLLNSRLVQSRIKSTASGSTVRHTAPSRILECEVRLPPLEEQARIVAIAKSLDDIVSAEERRRSDDEVTGPLSHLRGLMKVIAADLLSGNVRMLA